MAVEDQGSAQPAGMADGDTEANEAREELPVHISPRSLQVLPLLGGQLSPAVDFSFLLF